MLGGSLPSASFPTAIALNRIPNYMERMTLAINKAKTLYADLRAQVPEIDVDVEFTRKTFALVTLIRLNESVDTKKFLAFLNDNNISVNPKQHLNGLFLRTNVSILQMQNDKIIACFKQAVSHAKKLQ